MPCLALLEIGYAAACRPGGLKDIVRFCQQLTDNRQPLPWCILVVQEQLHNYIINTLHVIILDRFKLIIDNIYYALKRVVS